MRGYFAKCAVFPEVSLASFVVTLASGMEEKKTAIIVEKKVR